jgi:WD40 repeat protein
LKGQDWRFSPDGTTLALGGTLSKTVSLWDLSTLRLSGTGCEVMKAGSTTLLSVVMAGGSPRSGRRNGAPMGDGTVTQVAASRGGTTCLRFSPDDRVLATCDRERVALWEVEEPDGIADLRGHSDRIGALRFQS